MKKLKYFAIALVSVLAISTEVKALTDVECITAQGVHECQLSDDVVVNDSLRVQGNITLDLNGHTIKPANEADFNAGVVGVLRGAKLTVKDSVGNGKITTGESTVSTGLQVTLYGESATGDPATFVLESGTIEGKNYGISGNGNRHNTRITINGGSVIATDGTGIYHPHEGTITVNGGTISGKTGIEMRSGSLLVNGGEIIGTEIPLSVAPNGNGTTTDGAGIAIAQHTTLKDISVKIKGGTVKGYSAVYESNPQHNANVGNQVSLSITGGNFEAINGGEVVVYSEDLTNFVKRGTFNKAVDSNYVLDSVETNLNNGVYSIGQENYTELEDNESYKIDTKYESSIYTAPVETYDVELIWEDLHWVFVYEGEASNPTRNLWVTKEKYDEILLKKAGLTQNEINGQLLDSVATFEAPVLSIVVENNSVFAVDVDASVEQVSATGYSQEAGLKVANSLNSEYNTLSEVSALASNSNVEFYVKPTSTKFVNETGTTVNVTGEVKLAFSKAN